MINPHEFNDSVTPVIQEVVCERWSQHRKWGRQDHGPLEWVGILGEEFGEVSKAAIEHHFNGKPIAEYRAELIQVAAVAVAAVEALDRSTGKEAA